MRSKARATAWSCALMTIALACVTGFVGHSHAPSPPAPESLPSSVRMSVSSLDRVIIRGDELRLRIRAARIRVQSPTLLGPFRLGPSQSIEIDHLEVDSFGGLESFDSGFPRVDDVTETVSKLANTSATGSIAAVQVRGLRWTERRPDGTTRRIQASRCETSLRGRKLKCRSGIVVDHDNQRRFHSATLSRHGWRLRGLGDSEQTTQAG